MPDDEPTRTEETPPGPQPEQDTTPADEDADREQDSSDGPGVNEKSADSFPASDPPSW
jgi:hypothetical protein